MKKILLLAFTTTFFLLSQSGIAQILRYKASSFSVMEKTAKDKWGDWSAFEPSTVVIAVDTKKSRIVVNSQEIQLFKIMSFGNP